jgi:hypothetical protein
MAVFSTFRENLHFFILAFCWDIENKARKPQHERDVIVELSPEIHLRPYYNFRINDSIKFFVEAKAPWVEAKRANARSRLRMRRLMISCMGSMG